MQEIANLKANRQLSMSMLDNMVPLLQEEAAELYKTDLKAAIGLIDQFANANTVALHEEWVLLGYRLLGKYAFGSINMKTTMFPQWRNDVEKYVPAPVK